MVFPNVFFFFFLFIQTDQPIDKITKLYETEFFEDMAKLSVSQPTVVTRVRDYIPQIVNFVKTIEDKGLAYRTHDGEFSWYPSHVYK